MEGQPLLQVLCSSGKEQGRFSALGQKKIMTMATSGIHRGPPLDALGTALHCASRSMF